MTTTTPPLTSAAADLVRQLDPGQFGVLVVLGCLVVACLCALLVMGFAR